MENAIILGLLGLLVVFLLLLGHFLFHLLRTGGAQPDNEIGPPQNAIVVDGSNVMHWGDAPSSLVLLRVLRSLEQKGYHPVVFFDANVGYLLGDRYFDEAKLSQITDLSEQQICVVGKGVVADQSILMFASDHGLRVVTNDRFRDWRVQYPHAEKKGVLVGGTWREGAVVWRGKL